MSAEERLALGAAALTGVILGAAIVATRFVIDEVSTGLLALLRYTIGFILLAPLLRGAHAMRFAWRDVGPIALLGVGQFAVLITLLNFGLETVRASRAALLFSPFPLFAMLLAAVLGRERLSWLKTAGVLVSMAGVALVISEPAGSQHTRGAGLPTHGEMACLAAGFIGAACSIGYGPYLARYSALAVSGFAMLASVVVLAAFNASPAPWSELAEISVPGWAAIAFIGVSSSVGFYTWLFALRFLTPTRVSVFISVGPIVAALLGVLLLGESMSLRLMAALLAVVTGLLLALYRRGEPLSRLPRMSAAARCTSSVSKPVSSRR